MFISVIVSAHRLHVVGLPLWLHILSVSAHRLHVVGLPLWLYISRPVPILYGPLLHASLYLLHCLFLFLHLRVSRLTHVHPSIQILLSYSRLTGRMTLLVACSAYYYYLSDRYTLSFSPTLSHPYIHRYPLTLSHTHPWVHRYACYLTHSHTCPMMPMDDGQIMAPVSASYNTFKCLSNKKNTFKTF